jgi:hypothetical protein
MWTALHQSTQKSLDSAASKTKGRVEERKFKAENK